MLTIQQVISTAMQWLISGVLSARNQQLQYSDVSDAEIKQLRSAICAADIQHC